MGTLTERVINAGLDLNYSRPTGVGISGELSLSLPQTRWLALSNRVTASIAGIGYARDTISSNYYGGGVTLDIVEAKRHLTTALAYQPELQLRLPAKTLWEKGVVPYLGAGVRFQHTARYDRNERFAGQVIVGLPAGLHSVAKESLTTTSNDVALQLSAGVDVEPTKHAYIGARLGWDSGAGFNAGLALGVRL